MRNRQKRFNFPLLTNAAPKNIINRSTPTWNALWGLKEGKKKIQKDFLGKGKREKSRIE
jgi:hypothetical protein